MSMRVLLAEDDNVDAMFLQKSFAECDPNIEIIRAIDGESALQAMNDQTPDLILLDLVMPGTHGFDILREIRGDSTYAAVPVLVCSGSDAREDVIKSHKLGANAYIVKPQSPADYRALANSLHSFWFTWAQSARPETTR
ncbi:MAG: response regulator [Hyphomicrobiales bacterium]